MKNINKSFSKEIVNLQKYDNQKRLGKGLRH